MTLSDVSAQLAFLACGLVVTGLVLVIAGGLRAQAGRGSQRWPSATGRVLESRAVWDPMRGRETLQVRYVYQVGAREYQASRVSFREAAGFALQAGGPSLDEQAARYPTGQEVTVYYHPADPAQAVLEPGSGGGLLPLAAGGLFFVVGLLSGILALFV